VIDPDWHLARAREETDPLEIAHHVGQARRAGVDDPREQITTEVDG